MLIYSILSEKVSHFCHFAFSSVSFCPCSWVNVVIAFNLKGIYYYFLNGINTSFLKKEEKKRFC